MGEHKNRERGQMKKFLIASAVVITTVVLGASSARATIWASDSFNYANGDIVAVSGGTWTSFSGTSALNVLNGAANPVGTSSMDDQILLTGTHTSDALYAGFDANVVSWTATQGIGYFALFKDASTFNFFARTFVTNVAGQVEFGITTGATQPPIFSSPVALGSTHRVEIELDQTGASFGLNMAASLYLDGTLVGTSYSMLNSNYAISAFALRQSNTASQGSVLVDNLIVGDSLASVIPEPSTMVLLGFGLVSMLALGRRHVSRK
jgi:hypothetical protein